MFDVVIAGMGQTPVGEHWDISLRSLAARAILAALKDAGIQPRQAGPLKPQAVYIGNYLSSVVSGQANLGSLIADQSGLLGLESYTVEAAEASGAGAFRLGYMAVASGYVSTAVVVGVEKYTDMVGPAVEAAVAQALDYDYEGVEGITAAGQAGLLMQRYMHQYGVERSCFAGFAMLDHANGANNPNAYFRKPISFETYMKAGMLADPVSMFDMAPYADGAAAVVITRADLIPSSFPHPLVRVTGSNSSIDTLALHDRVDPLAFQAAAVSVERACRQAGILPTDVDFFELSDAFTIHAALSLEAAGFAPRGSGWKLAQDGSLALNGKLPVNTMGGMKARGNPLSASGVYQIVEATQQLRGTAGKNQLAKARRALVQSLGGPASTAITHVLEN